MKNTITKTELIRVAAVSSTYMKNDEEYSLTQKQVEVALNALIGVVSASLVKGDKVQIAGFGTFEVSERSAREGRNPSTGEPMVIPASRSVKFKPAKSLKDELN